jgi:hypothetical protein
LPVVMYMEWDGVTPEQYDEVRGSVDWEGDPPDGAMLHVPWFVDGGIRVVDVWESPEKFQAFSDERLAQGTQAAGIEGEPRVDFRPLHSRIFAPDVAGAGG